MFKTHLPAAVAAIVLGSTLLADTVNLKNGDKLTGTVGAIAGGEMAFESPVFGKVKLKMADVDSFSLDAPVPARLNAGGPRPEVTGGGADTFTSAAGEIPSGDVKILNPPAQTWTGAIVATFAVARGNTNTLDAGVDIGTSLRRDDEQHNDRFFFGGEYNLGTNGTGSTSVTTTDNWLGEGKYDKFVSEKLYLFANLKIEHDRIAQLNYRLTPSVGVGYQWIESPDRNFNTEAGVAYVYEDYTTSGEEDSISLRLAYHYDNKLAENLILFHNVEYLPAFEDPSDFLLKTDIGLRTLFTAHFFGEFKFQWDHDSTPANGQSSNDLKYVVGLGYTF